MKLPRRSSSAAALPQRSPVISPDQAISLLQQQMEKGEQLLQKRLLERIDLGVWQNTTRDYLAKAFGEPSENVNAFIGSRGGGLGLGDVPEAQLEQWRREDAQRQLAVLKGLIEILNTEAQLAPRTRAALQPTPLSLIERMCQRFHVVARQLRIRHQSRPTIDIEDEYDIQDLLHALLRLHFDDVRPEEHTPSYAGKASRMDFLLKHEKTVLEVKKTRPGLTDKEIGTQLIEDIVRYQTHPDCRTLVCFVYDPEGRIGNPAGLERDLGRSEDNLEVRVLVFPKGH